MYIVKLDNKKIFDQRIDELTLIEPVIQLEENSAGSFTFTIAKEHPYYDEIKRRSSIIQVYEDDELLFSGMVYEVTEDFFCNRKIYCEGELSYFNDTIQRPAEYHDMTVRGLLEKYINNHNAQVEKEKQFKVGMVTVTDSNNSIYCYTNMETTLSCIKSDLVDDLGGVIRVRHSNGYKYIDYLKEDDTRTNNQVIRLGENLINYKSNISSLDIATAIIPLGAKLEESPIEALDMRLDIKSVNNNLDYVADSVSVNTFGWIYKTVIWDNVTTASALKQKGIKYLEDTQFDNLVIEVNAVDMHLIDTDEVPYRLSDKIRIISAPHGLKNKYFRLTKQTINLNNPENNTITLGKEEHLSLSARTVQANSDVLKAMESITPESTILRHAKENASALINGNGENGYVVLHENDKGVVYEILIMDTPSLDTATKIWRWNQNGFGYANSKNADGTWKFGTAITMDGAIVADFITAGVLSGDMVRGGSIEIGGTGYGKDGSLVVKNKSGTTLVTLNSSGLTLSGGQTISYSSISDKPTIPTDVSDLTDDTSLLWTTTIADNWISTETITAQNLTAGHVAASGITTGTIYACQFGSGQNGDTSTINMKNKAGVGLAFGADIGYQSALTVLATNENRNASNYAGKIIVKAPTQHSGNNYNGMYIDVQEINYYDWNQMSSGAYSGIEFQNTKMFSKNDDWEIDGVVVSGSDLRLKDNIKDISVDLIRKLFSKLNFKSFVYKRRTDKEAYGLIAQEVESALDELGIEKSNIIFEDDGYYKLSYENIDRFCIPAIKDLYEICDRQQKEIDRLREELKK